jgi:hypothetical protein
VDLLLQPFLAPVIAGKAVEAPFQVQNVRKAGSAGNAGNVDLSGDLGDPALVFLHHRIAQYADFFDLGFNYIPGLQETGRFHCHTYPFGRSRKNDRSR